MEAEKNHRRTWTTAEQHILSFALIRHGLDGWDAVANELQKGDFAATATHKLSELDRRLAALPDSPAAEASGDPDQLRKVGLAELYADLKRREDAIQ